jgi:hypothetical protein
MFTPVFFSRLFFATTVPLVWAQAHAGRPMVVDDAGIVAHRVCQMEAWTQRNQDTSEYWAVPACNFSGNLEVAVGAARVRAW